MDKGLEVRVADWPVGGWEGILMMMNGHIAVQCTLCRFSNLTVDKEDLLMCLATL
jgi:hypothetical protein